MRPDLLALTPETLAALTNRGLVKRATKEVAAAPPELSEESAGESLGTVVAAFPDGPVATLPAGGLEAGGCTCGAGGVCRHIIGLVLAYQAASEIPAPPAEEFVDWSPGGFTDEALRERVGPRLFTRARRTFAAGYPARVRRPTAADPVPTVELGSATVRFLVPHDLGFVHTDAVAGVRDDVVALAVWAFRAADGCAPGQRDLRLDVGGPAVAAGGGDPLDSLERAVELATDVLRHGAVHTGPGIAAQVADVRRRLEADGLRWPQFTVLDLETQLAAYRERNARYRPELLAGYIAELHARRRATRGPGAASRTRVLGTDEAAETPLRRVRLDSLGCRVTATGDERRAEVFLAHADTATVLVLRREWTAEEDGPALAARRVGGTTLRSLAEGSVVTESAVRSASRAVRLGTSRVARTSVTVSGGWAHLPPALLANDFAALAAELDGLPPRVVRPRIAAELVRVLAVAEVRHVAYRPGEQRLDAVIADAHGATATVRATYSRVAPGALDALAAALDGAAGPLTHVSGTVRRSAGGLLLDPLGVAVGGGIVAPDLAVRAARELVTERDAAGPDRLTAALLSAGSLLADVAHHGLTHLPPSVAERAGRAAEDLAAVGLRRVAAALTAFRQRLGDDEPPVREWVDAHLRVETALDLC
ncbi:hypothetical protein Val02_10480 [Virgisporangium aliadipatigenens]|uniref:SWIM-type domain-containing protein n=1 Tax=Virgisporangium aliadipatigenens TaxID=741659 RepID=A0A8J3YGV3_9ACTN|nr:hypothetical protein [Virgisporangium aliadipatigenens]GIJ44162.1 hypothetical protein Val02_10480 [Virgisporangium aliadipatigenens]